MKEIQNLRRLILEWRAFDGEDALHDITKRTAKKMISKLEKKQKELYDQLKAQGK